MQDKAPRHDKTTNHEMKQQGKRQNIKVQWSSRVKQQSEWQNNKTTREDGAKSRWNAMVIMKEDKSNNEERKREGKERKWKKKKN